MANDSPDDQPPATPVAAIKQVSAGGIALLLFACLPYIIMVGMLPDADDFPNEGGGEARMAWGFQQFWAYTGCAATLVLLTLALWRASRAGGIAGWARQALPLPILAAGVAMTFAISQTFEQPGPWLPLVPTVLPPVLAAYALIGCLPPLSRRLRPAQLDAVAIGLIGAVSLAVIPLGLLDTASYPQRLARHHAELAAADAASKAAGAQAEQALRTKFASLGPNSSLRDYLDGEYWYLSGVDVLAGARQVNSRQSDANAMLDDGLILDLSDLWQLDLQPTQPLCAAYGKALAARFGRSDIGRGSAYLSLLDRQFANMQWLHDGQCNLDGPIGEVDAQLAWMLESKDPSDAAPNDYAAYFSRWGVSRETVAAMRGKLATLRGAR
jgi:hypothetical protein